VEVLCPMYYMFELCDAFICCDDFGFT
jgi:hypothetical protein